MQKNYRPDFTYADFARDFTTEFYEPEKWATLFQKAGAKYVVLTSKHHEGFTNWPSKVSFNWNSMDVGPKRDLVGELASAVRNKTDLHFGLYHSMMDWFHPLYLQDKANKFKTQDFVFGKALPELHEIIESYKPDVIWSDGDWEAPDTYWNATHFLAWLYNDSPVKDSVLVNDRWGIGIPCKHGDFYNCQDKYNPGVLQAHKWENAMTLDKKSWGYRRQMTVDDVLTVDDLLTTMAKTISCNGNILINLGPRKDGTIDPIFEERLLQLGEWLDINGEAIYSSKPWKYQNDTINSDVWYTSKGKTAYAIVLKWPKDNQLKLGALSTVTVANNAVISLMGYDKPLQYDLSANGITIQMPQLTVNDKPKYAMVLKISNTV